MAYGPGDRPGGAKPRKRKRTPAPRVSLPAIKEAHAQHAKDIAKAGQAQDYIRKAVATPVLENERAKGNPRGRKVSGAAMENERAKARGATPTRPRTFLDLLGPREKGQRLRSHTTTEQIQENVAKLFSEHRTASEQADAADRLKELGILPGGPKPSKLVTVGRELPKGPGGGHSGRYLAKEIGPGGKIGKTVIRTADGRVLDRNIGVKQLTKILKGAIHSPNKIGIRLPGQSQDRGLETLGPQGKKLTSSIVDRSVKSGLTATGGVIMEGLDRPAGATEAAVAKGLVAAGAIKGDTAEKIRKAPGPGKVLAHGRDWGKDITGADITGGLGLGRVTGIGADLVIDPVMWAGLGLAPETGGASLAVVGDRLARIAPAIRHSDQVERIFAAHKAGDLSEKAAMRQLRRVIHPRNVKGAQAERNRAIVQKALEGKTTIKVQVPKRGLRGRKLVTKEVHIPANADEVVAETLRHGEARQIRPQLRVNLMTPTGRRLAGVNIPDFGLVGRTPIAMRRSKAAVDAARRAARTHMTAEMDRHLKELDGRISHLERTKAAPEKILELRSQKQAIKDEYLKKTKIAEDLADAEVRRRTVGDLVSEHNLRMQAVHNARIASQDFGRMVNNKYAKAIEDATKAIPFGPERERSLQRVQMYLNTWADTKGTGLSHLAETIGPMDRNEQVVFTNLRRLYRKQGEADIKSGVLRRTLDDYVGQRAWETANADVLAGMPTGRRGMTTSFQQHRAVAGVADYADPHELAQALKRLSHNDISDEQALAAAERLWQTGHVRTVSDLTRRRLLRGETVMWEDLTPYEKSAIDRAARTGLANDREVPLFRTPLTDPDTEGQVLLNNSDEAVRTYNLDLGELPDDQRIPYQILSAVADRQKVAELHANAAGPVKADLARMHERLTNEIEAKDLAHPGELAHAQLMQPEGKLGRKLSDAQRKKRARERVAALKAGETPKPIPERGFMTGGRTPEEQYHLERMAERSPAPLHEIDDAIESGDPEQLKELAPGYYEAQADQNGDLWIKGIRDNGGPPIEGIVPRPNEALPHANPFDYFSSLPDFRAPALSGEMVNLDPRAIGYTRARAAGMSAAWQARWQGFDKQYGRSAAEAKQVTFHTSDGHAGFANELFPIRDENGFITGYRERGVPAKKAQHWDAADVQFERSTLIPDAKEDYWVDTATGTEYASPRKAFESGLMLHNLDEDRLWPTQAIEQLKLDSARSGEMDNVWDAVYQDSLTKGVQNVMGKVRFFVTSPFPAYHIRNLMSDLIKSIQADSGVLFHPITNFKMLAAAAGQGLDWNIKVKGYGKMKMEDFLFMADMFGVKSGHHVAEVAALLHHGDFTNTRLQKMIRNSWFAAGGKSTKFGAHREDIVRFMTFTQRMRANGGDAADAAWYTIRHHFNYNDLSGVERKYVRNVFLFYTWYRKNIPLQLVELVRRPGFFAGISHTYNALAAGDTPLNVGPLSGAAPAQPYLPGYVKDKLLSATTNWNDHALNIGFGAPYADLSFVSLKGVKDLISLITPPAALALQYATRQDPLTGRRYKTREASGIASAYNEIYKHFTGHDLPLDENGNPTLPWRLSIALRQVPFLGRATYSLGGTSTVRDQGRLQKYGSLLGNITGLNVYVSPTPGSEREDYARKKFLTGNVSMERRQVQEDISNFPTSSKFYKRQLSEADKRALQFLREHGLPLSALQDIKNSGYYQGQGQRRRPKGLGSSLSSGLGGGGLGG